MLIYMCVICWVLLFSLLSIDKNMKSRDKVVYGFMLLVLIPVAGLRVDTGVDYDSYYEHYKDIKDIYHFSRTYQSLEVGYEYLVSAFKTIDTPFHVFTFAIALVTFILYGRLCYKYSSYPSLSLLMFFAYAYWGQVMGQMRQPLAIFLLYQFLFLIIKKKELLFTGVVILTGFLFHKANLFFLFPLFFLTKKLKVRHYLLILFSCIIVGFLCNPFVKQVINILPSDDVPFGDAIVAYMTYKANPVLFTTGMIERIFLWMIATYFCWKYGILQRNAYNRLFYNMYFYGICWYFLFITISSDFAARGSSVLTFSMFFLFPNILKAISNRKEYTIFLLIIMIWAIYLSLKILVLGDNYIPYKSIFS